MFVVTTGARAQHAIHPASGGVGPRMASTGQGFSSEPEHRVAWGAEGSQRNSRSVSGAETRVK